MSAPLNFVEQAGAGAEAGVEAVFCQEFRVFSTFNNVAAIQNKNLIRVEDGGEAVGNDEAGSFFQQAIQGFLDKAFGGVVHAGGGFVEDEDGGIFQKGAGDGETLLFTNAETYAAFADFGVEPFGEAADKVSGIGGPQDDPQLFIGRTGFSKVQVVGDSSVEKEAFLGDEADGLTQIFFGEAANVMSVEGDGTVVPLIKPHEQANEGGFAGTGGADEGDGFARLHREANVVQHRGVVSVGKIHALEANFTPQRNGEGRRAFIGLRRGVQDVEDAATGGSSGLKNLIELMEASDGFVKEADKDKEGDQHAEIEATVEGGPAADGEDNEIAEGGEKIHAGVVKSPGPHDDEGGFAEPCTGGVEEPVFVLLARITLDLTDAVEIVVQQGVESRRGTALCRVAFPGGGGENNCSNDQERHGGEGAQGEHGTPKKHEDRHDTDLQNGHRTLLDAVNQHALHAGHILRYARHDVARGAVIEPGEREGLQSRVEIAAQVKENLLLKSVVEKNAQDIEAVLHEESECGQCDHRQQGLCFSTAQNIIHDALGDNGEDDDGDSGAEGAGEGGGGQERIASQVGEDAHDNLRFGSSRHDGV